MTEGVPARGALGRLRALAIVVKVVVALLAVEWWVRGPFFDSYVMPRFAGNHVFVRERSGGRQPSILFDVVEKLPRRGVRVAFLGDSAMVAFGSRDETAVPFLVRERLRRRLGRFDIDAVDASVIGLYASDGAIFVSKLLGAKVDVIVYGVLLRAFAQNVNTKWVTGISSEMGPQDLMRMTAAGGFPWLVRNVGLENIVAGVVHTTWATYAYRTAIGDTLTTMVPQLGIVLHHEPMERQPAVAPRPMAKAGALNMAREQFGYPSAHWEAFELLGCLCGQYAPGRCVVFSSPINPEGREEVIEPGLYEEFRERMRVMAGRSGMVWRDYTDALTPADFIPPTFPGQKRDAIHMNGGGRVKLAKLLTEPVGEIVARISRERDGQGALPPPVGD